MLTKLNYEELAEKLKETINWLNDCKIKTVNSRLDEINNYVNLINRAYQEKNLQELIDRIGNELVFYALTEAASFIEIYGAFKRGVKKDHLPKEALKKIISGPFIPTTENSTTNEARNRLFELQLAAQFIDHNIFLKGFDDISFSFKGNDIHVQCKRPFSKTNLLNNIIRADEQLKISFKTENDRGIIALSVDKVMDLDSKFISVPNENSIDKSLLKPVDDFIQQNRLDQLNFINAKVIALLIVTKFVVHIRDIELLTTCFLTHFIFYSSEKYEEQLVNELHKQLIS